MKDLRLPQLICDVQLQQLEDLAGDSQWIGLGDLNRKPWIFPFNMGLSCKLSRENQSIEIPLAPVIPPEAHLSDPHLRHAACGVGVPRLFNMCITLFIGNARKDAGSF